MIPRSTRDTFAAENVVRALNDATKGTTGQSTDGGPSTGGEEWTPDYMSDETA